MKKILSCLSCMLLLFSILTACSSDVETRELVWNENGYESLLQAEEFKEIEKLSGDILSVARATIYANDLEITMRKEDIHFELAYKFYMVNPLELEDLEQDLPRAEYVWKIPIITENGHLIVSCLLNRQLNKDSKGLYTDSSYRMIVNHEVYWQASTAIYYPEGTELLAEKFDNAINTTNLQNAHKIVFGNSNRMTGLYGVALENNKPVYMVPLDHFTAYGVEHITANMKSAGDFQDGQVYAYEDFAERMSRVKEAPKSIFATGGGRGLVTNPTKPKFLEGIKPEGIVLLVIIAAFLLTTGGVLVYQKVKDRVR